MASSVNCRLIFLAAVGFCYNVLISATIFHQLALLYIFIWETVPRFTNHISCQNNVLFQKAPHRFGNVHRDRYNLDNEKLMVFPPDYFSQVPKLMAKVKVFHFGFGAHVACRHPNIIPCQAKQNPIFDIFVRFPRSIRICRKVGCKIQW